jgi:HD-like signal output (HDOD) protein
VQNSATGPGSAGAPSAGDIPETIVERIENDLVERLSSERLTIPPYPSVAARLGRIVGSHGAKIADIQKVVQADQALAASVLAYANSAACAVPGRVRTLEQAISLIGTQELMRRAFATGLGTWAAAPGPVVSLRRLVWRRALASGHVCQMLAQARGIDPDQAFLCGLLHDFGEVVVLATCDSVIRARKTDSLPAKAWLDLCQRHHVSVGMLLATRWNLPDVIRAVVQMHHNPERCMGSERRTIELVASVDRIAWVLEEKPTPTEADLPTVSPAERAEILRRWPAVAASVASYEAEPTGPDVASAVAPAPSSSDWLPVTLTVRCIRRQSPALFHGTGLQPNTMLLEGTEPLAVNSLVKLEIVSGQLRFDLLANVVSCVEDGSGSSRIEARPYGLHGAAANDWNRLVLEAREQGKGEGAPAPLTAR